jgi:hypothetical protein
MSRLASFATVGAGSVVVCLVYGWFGVELRKFGEEHELPTWAKVGGALVFVGGLALFGRWLARRSPLQGSSAGAAPGGDPEGRRRQDTAR